MKRSEMIKEMLDYHMHNTPDELRGRNYLEGWFTEYLQGLLTHMEEAGMLPPCSDIYCICDHATGDANKWEDEDEEETE
jgi:hypothetical protein